MLLRWNDQQPRNPSRFIVVNNIFNRLDYDLRLNLLEGWNIVSDNFLHNRFGQGTRVGVTPRFADPGRDDYRLAEGSAGHRRGHERLRRAPARSRRRGAARRPRGPEPRVGAAGLLRHRRLRAHGTLTR